ncbi:uncharacterized protein LOC110185095 isoform X2 [Drosophila serrata]|nr:uncharacterized protein LOC110185095 isoform X2 [Drosophila serrata]
MDYSTYAQLSGFPYMPTPEIFYPEMGGAVRQQEQQKQCDGFQQGSSQDYQASQSAPDYYQYQGQGQENKSDGFQANPYSSGRQYTSSEYRCMAREQKRAKEMRSRNGL